MGSGKFKPRPPIGEDGAEDGALTAWSVELAEEDILPGGQAEPAVDQGGWSPTALPGQTWDARLRFRLG